LEELEDKMELVEVELPLKDVLEIEECVKESELAV
jgi:hypothetical protein